jgi:hypothetical protein
MLHDNPNHRPAAQIPTSTDITVGKHTIRETVWRDGKSEEVTYAWEGGTRLDREQLKDTLERMGFGIGDFENGEFVAIRGGHRFECRMIVYNRTTLNGRLSVANKSLVDRPEEKVRIRAALASLLDAADVTVLTPSLRL